MRISSADYEIRKSILDKIEQVDGEPEMTEYESAFLVRCIREKKPHKIVEVGIAAGATSAIIINTIVNIMEEEEEYECNLYSVDLSTTYYRDNTKKSGFMGEIASKELKFNNHTMMLGKYLPERLDEIGRNIDFVILDTVHALPGEVLDFLAIFPYLQENAVVCIHDLTYHQKSVAAMNMNSNALLYSSVVGEKLYAFLPQNEIDGADMPNIGAIRITSDTRKYIANVFMALLLNWHYKPTDYEISTYRKWLSNNYSCNEMRLFENALIYGNRTMFRKTFAIELTEDKMNYIQMKCRGKNVVLWGAGNVCSSILLCEKLSPLYILDNNLGKIGNKLFGIPIIKPEKEKVEDKFIVITCLDSEKIEEQLKCWGIEKENYITAQMLIEET